MWWCWHRIKWDDPFQVPLHVTLHDGFRVGASTKYVETRQRGTCKKCGYVKEHVVRKGIYDND